MAWPRGLRTRMNDPGDGKTARWQAFRRIFVFSLQNIQSMENMISRFSVPLSLTYSFYALSLCFKYLILNECWLQSPRGIRVAALFDNFASCLRLSSLILDLSLSSLLLSWAFFHSYFFLKAHFINDYRDRNLFLMFFMSSQVSGLRTRVLTLLRCYGLSCPG